MNKKTFFLIVIVFLTACAGNNSSVIDEVEMVPSASPMIEVENIGEPEETSQLEIEVGTATPSVDVTSTSLNSDSLDNNEEEVDILQVTAEPYPGQIITPEPPPGNPLPSNREPKVGGESYPSPEEDLEEFPVYGYEVVNEFVHDPQAFTQGLVVTNGGKEFIEGTGLWGQSSLRRVEIESGEVIQYRELPDEVFGEGLTEFEGQIYQLTWKSNLGYIYDSQSFDQVGEFEYFHEGWGITHDGQEFIVSDGTSTIYFWDPQTLNETRQIQVVGPDGPITRLNELEYYQGEILANVWQTNLIARISPDDGQVLGWIDLTGLHDAGLNSDPDDVLNGIAYDEQTDKLYVTGKRWPVLFEIELVENS